jgi:hypothetical protein
VTGRGDIGDHGPPWRGRWQETSKTIQTAWPEIATLLRRLIGFPHQLIAGKGGG